MKLLTGFIVKLKHKSAYDHVRVYFMILIIDL